jgi:hypothetical protein
MPRSVAVFAVAAATFAALLVSPASASAATVTSVRSWSAGTMTPGQTKSYTWNNANSDIYQVNAGGVMTGDPGTPCWTQVTRQWYRRAAGGARLFLLTIKNIDSASCDVTVYLGIITADRSGSTGVINPGQAKSWLWHNSNFASNVYFAAVTPNDPGSGTCQLEVAGRNRVVPSGEQQYVWTVRNTGSVACDGQWRLGWLPVQTTAHFPADDSPGPPGRTGFLGSPVQDPFRVYFYGILLVATSDGNCDWAPTTWSTSGDPAIPTPGARTEADYVNAGSVSCVVAGVTETFIP